MMLLIWHEIELPKPDNYDYDLVDMLNRCMLMVYNFRCGICNARCGLFKNEPYFDEKVSSTMQILADWTIQSDKVLTF